MFKNLSIKNKFILLITMGCVIPYIFGGIYIKNYTENYLYNNSIKGSRQLLFEISKRVDDSIIKRIKEDVNMLAIDDRIIGINGNINSYINYESENYEDLDSEYEKSISNYFGSFKETHENINFLFLGMEDGGYIEYPKFLPKNNYDPRIRPWYENTIDSDGVRISKPYLTKVTEDLVLSFSKKIKTSKNKNGVIGVAVNLNDLTESINSLKINELGYVVVLDEDNNIIVSPKHKEWILKNIEEVNLTKVKTFDISNESYEVMLDGSKKIINIFVSPHSDWKYISVEEKNEILNESNQMMRILVFIYILILLIIVILIILVSKNISKPIFEISSEIENMANFKFDSYNNYNFEKYRSSKNEVAIIIKSLDYMYENFSELNDSIYQLNKEINDIDIEKKSYHKLTLSNENPFEYVALSINNLIEKIQKYFEQISKSNTEITKKNELLQVTEEELIAQISEISEQKEYINYLAYHDALTELPNRRKFIEKLSYVLNKNYKGAVILLDLDNFKAINDSLGHVFGDIILREFSKRLIEISNENIFISRFGGDEFLVLTKCQNMKELNEFILYIRSSLDDKFIVDKNEIEIKFSMGITFFPDDSIDINELIMNADLALYSAKSKGKDKHEVFNKSMRDKLNENIEIENLLSEAIENSGFKMLYQPQINIFTGEIIAFEALIRLKEHMISPAKFIPIAEESGMIIKIGRIVTNHVIKQLYYWKEKGYPIKPVSINFSANQLYDMFYFDFLMEILNKYDIDPKFIEIEITENVFLDNKELALEFVNKLRNENIKISIDDFGTGYSSISYLTFLPIDKVKFDRSLSMEFLNMENISTLDSLIMVMHSLNLEVVAEGIEEYEDVKKLRVGKCDNIQGYYFSKPLEKEDVEEVFYRNYLDKI
ncbi:EAL domain-containing protein [Clostridiaceae bacterium HSG29]|nr:EAL domain-containing protein [Clostridiaceae bacterium HSG29]